MSNDTKIALWKNERREKDTQPILSGGKPQQIAGTDFWVSAWINAGKDADPELVKRINALVDYLDQQNGSYPIISVSLREAESRQQQNMGGVPDDSRDIPFLPLRGLV